LQQEREGGKRLAAQPIDFGNRLATQGVVVRSERRRVVLGHRTEHFDGGPWRESAVRAAMKGGNNLSQTRHRGQRKSPLFRHAIIELGLIEAPHDKRPFHRLATAVEMQFSMRISGYRNDFEIKARCDAAIDAKLIAQGVLAAFEGREIEKRIFDLAFNLVGTRASQK